MQKLLKGKSLYIGTYARIPVKIHWTFMFISLMIAYQGYDSGLDTMGYVWLTGYFLTLFLCVLLHEYGHCLAARRYGIDTQDILLTPIGGIARLMDIPEKPLHEFVVAIAGPLVNVAIATILGLVLYGGLGGFADIADGSLKFITSPKGFLSGVFVANIVLFVFNLVPAFPMDGGRILRAGLSHFYGRLKGTKYAMWIGSVFSIIFFFIGIYYEQYTLIFIGMFISFMARTEYRNILTKETYKKIKTKNIIRREHTFVYTHQLMEDVIKMSFQRGEKSFLVYDLHGDLVGALPQLFLVDFYKNGQPHETVREYMSTNVRHINVNASAATIQDIMQREGVDIVPITEGGKVIGVLDRATIEYALKFYL